MFVILVAGATVLFVCLFKIQEMHLNFLAKKKEVRFGRLKLLEGLKKMFVCRAQV